MAHKIACGSCRGEHETVRQIQECHQKPKANPASEKQLNLCQMLARQRERLEEFEGLAQLDYENTIQGFSKPQASQFIDKMRQQPFSQNAWKLPHPEVLAGRYALKVAGGGIRFYAVLDEDPSRNLPRNVFQLIGSPGEYTYRPLVNSNVAETVMAEIAENPMEAVVRYGLESSVCGLCGSPLTNESSRAAGIGPVCQNKL